MRKILIFLLIFKTFSFANWYEKNKELKVIFPQNIWQYIEKANDYSKMRNIKYADIYLRKAKENIERCEPFTPDNWPKGWPRDKESLKFLKYSTPTGFINRIIGDFCLDNGYNKEAIKYYEKYLGLSIIPDSTYYITLAEIYEKEGMLNQALNLYEEIYKFIENKNYWGKEYDTKTIEKKIKNINLFFKKNLIIVLSPLYIDIPTFISSDFEVLFLDEIKKIKNIIIVSKEEFNRVLNQERINEKEMDDDDLSTVGKILNVRYALKPILSKIGESYILNVDVFSVEKKNWFESYEYKTDDYRYIPNLIKRFCFNFQSLEIPPQLYLPETKFLWSFEADGLITDFKISENGEKIIAGTETGSIYILNKKGRLLRTLKVSDKIIKVAVSPDGKYFSFFSINGKLYFLDENGKIIWIYPVENYGRGIGISEEGRFISFGINDRIFYMDKNKEIFWEEKLPDWISYIHITKDAHYVFIGLENGSLYCFLDDGNLKWKKELKEKIINITSRNEYICIETEKGRIFLFNLNGNEIKNFNVDENVNFTFFSSEILELITGKKGSYLYFFSNDNKNLWKYLLKERVNFAKSTPDGKFIFTVETRNIFAFSILWK